MKHIKLISTLVIICALGVLLTKFRIEKNLQKEKESSRLESMIQQMRCGSSFTVNEIQYPETISSLEKLLQHCQVNDSVMLGNNPYKSIGASYNWDGKFVWELSKNDSSSFEILIEDQDAGMDMVKYMTVSLVCKQK